MTTCGGKPCATGDTWRGATCTTAAGSCSCWCWRPGSARASCSWRRAGRRPGCWALANAPEESTVVCGAARDTCASRCTSSRPDCSPSGASFPNSISATSARCSPRREAEGVPMKVLLCHNFYQQPGGEDQVFADEGALLERHGHEVVRYTRHNDEIDHMGRLEVARKTLYNSQTYAELYELMGRERPDLMHCTNTFPLISP